jgi:short-subunit dehydrogenase
MVAPYFSNYAGSKAYVLQMGASLYGELKPKGVDVSVLSPGLIKTAMAAGSSVDWDKLPMAAKEPSVVAEIAINGLGKRFLSIPGVRNKLISWMANLTPLGLQAILDEMMIKRAIHAARL